MASEHLKYVVTVVEVVRETSKETEQFCTKETPTEIVEEDYGNKRKAAVAKEYDIRDVEKVELKELQVYRQESATLDLVAVITAVNKGQS